MTHGQVIAMIIAGAGWAFAICSLLDRINDTLKVIANELRKKREADDDAG